MLWYLKLIGYVFCFGLVLFIIISHYIKKQNEAIRIHVKNNSSAVQTMSVWKKRMEAMVLPVDMLEGNMRLSISRSSLQSFRNFNPDKEACLWVEKYAYDLRDIHENLQFNRNLYAEMEEIMSGFTIALSERNYKNRNGQAICKYKKWRCFELELIEENRPNIPISVSGLHIGWRYDSPKGRNHYGNFRVYSWNDLLEMAEEMSDKRSSAKRERNKMKPKLRYKIMQRDGFKCTICGRSADDGVKLHVDHIRPVSKGGLTVENNLRTLCEDCNLGKSDSYVENSLN